MTTTELRFAVRTTVTDRRGAVVSVSSETMSRERAVRYVAAMTVTSERPTNAPGTGVWRFAGSALAPFGGAVTVSVEPLAADIAPEIEGETA